MDTYTGSGLFTGRTGEAAILGARPCFRSPAPPNFAVGGPSATARRGVQIEAIWLTMSRGGMSSGLTPSYRVVAWPLGSLSTASLLARRLSPRQVLACWWAAVSHPEWGDLSAPTHGRPRRRLGLRVERVPGMAVTGVSPARADHGACRPPMCGNRGLTMAGRRVPSPAHLRFQPRG
jgi:hypothetical protein